MILRRNTIFDKDLVMKLMNEHWGGEPLIVRDKNYYPSRLPGIFAESGNKIVGFLFYEISAKNCEIVVFEAFDKFQGIGTRLLERLIDIAKEHLCERIFLMTHNDNLDALRFYQRRGFSLCSIRFNSMDAARKNKPSIPLIGDYAIPIRDEIDLEIKIIY